MTNINFILRDGTQQAVEAEDGQTLLQIAKQYDLDIEGACGGAMACSTCHMIIDPAWFRILPAASDEENEMLDLAPELTKTSRLGCQIRVTAVLDGLVVKLPPSP